MMYTDVESRHEDISGRECGLLSYTISPSVSWVTFDLSTETVTVNGADFSDIEYSPGRTFTF